MNDGVNQIVTFITGAGGAGVVMFSWIKNLIREKCELNDQLKDERKRNNEYGESIIAIASEIKLRFEHADRGTDEVKTIVVQEHDKTRREIRVKHDETRG